MSQDDDVQRAVGRHDAAGNEGQPPGAETAAPPLEQIVDAEGALPAQPRRAPSDAVRAYVLADGGEQRALSIDAAVDAARGNTCLVWVDLSEYSADDLRDVAERFGLAERAVRGVIEEWRRPRLLTFRDHFFVNVTLAEADVPSRQVEARELDCFVGENVFISIHKAPLPFDDRIRERARQSADLVCGESAFMLFIVLDELFITYDRLAEEIGDEIERMEERALFENSDRLLDDLLRLKRFIFAVHRLAEQHREVVAAFLRPDFRWVSGEEVEPYFRDLQAHHADLVAQLATQRAGVNDAFEIYVSQVAHRTNYIVKVLTMVSAMLLPMTAVFGLFGTNFQIEGLYTDANFWLMLLGVITLSGGTLWIFRWRRWL